MSDLEKKQDKKSWLEKIPKPWIKFQKPWLEYEKLWLKPREELWLDEEKAKNWL